MKWFDEIFLPSLHERIVNNHGKAVTFITPKQADICYRYFKAEQHNSDYGYFDTYRYEYNGKNISLSEEGKYIKIYWNEMPPTERRIEK